MSDTMRELVYCEADEAMLECGSGSERCGMPGCEYRGYGNNPPGMRPYYVQLSENGEIVKAGGLCLNRNDGLRPEAFTLAPNLFCQYVWSVDLDHAVMHARSEQAEAKKGAK